MQEERNWPTIDVTFTERPAAEVWDAFNGVLGYRLTVLGLEEIDVLDGVPQQVTFFFDEEGDLTEILSAVKEVAAEILPPDSWTAEPRSIPNEDWGKNWRRHFHTMRVGNRVYVGPPWERELPLDAPEDAVHILIDPGQAFGTGSHESTQLCLRLLENQFATRRCLLDIGTGSGILSFAAIKLGMDHGIGVEYDPVCEENFYLNADINEVRESVRFVLSAVPAEGLATARAQGSPAPDLAICNMLSERFKPLLPGLASLGLPLILSGFMMSELEHVTAAVTAAGFKIDERYQLDEWTAFVLSAP